MNSSMWVPLGGIWLVGMLLVALVARSRSIRFRLSAAVDIAAFACVSIAVIAGMAVLSERSPELLGIPSTWMSLGWCLVCLRGLVILKGWHESKQTQTAADAT